MASWVLVIIRATILLSPPTSAPVEEWSKVFAGGQYTAGIKNDGTLWMWGRNGDGQLGLGDLTDRLSPVQVGSASNWSEVALGEQHTLALRANGSLWAWGATDRLGLWFPTPTQLSTESNWVEVAAGGRARLLSEAMEHFGRGATTYWGS